MGFIYMKYNNTYFIQLSRTIFDDKYKTLSVNAKWLYCVLNELEHRFSRESDGLFYRTNEELAEDSGMSLATLKRAKKELAESGLIEICKVHFITNGVKSKKQITGYRISSTV